jgi:uncharacterized membrane protein YfcA
MTFSDTILPAATMDGRFWAAFAIAALSGVVRGFSGFGSAMIYIPLVAAVYEPRTAAVTLLLIDFVCTAPFSATSLRHCAWREVLPIWIAAAVAIPFGTWALLIVNPTALRWFIALLILSLLPILMSGWRYHGRPRLPVTLAVGLISGFGGGAVQIAGPPVIVYWFGSKNPAATIRANLLVYFLLTGAASCVVYLAQGLFAADLLVLAFLFGIPYFAATALGARLFRRSSDWLYTRIAYGIIAVAAVLSLPVFDGLLR